MLSFVPYDKSNDIEIIKSIIKSYGFDCSAEDCEKYWRDFSEQNHSASWLVLPEKSKDIFEKLIPFINIKYIVWKNIIVTNTTNNKVEYQIDYGSVLYRNGVVQVKSLGVNYIGYSAKLEVLLFNKIKCSHHSYITGCSYIIIAEK